MCQRPRSSTLSSCLLPHQTRVINHHTATHQCLPVSSSSSLFNCSSQTLSLPSMHHPPIVISCIFFLHCSPSETTISLSSSVSLCHQRHKMTWSRSLMTSRNPPTTHETNSRVSPASPSSQIHLSTVTTNMVDRAGLCYHRGRSLCL